MLSYLRQFFKNYWFWVLIPAVPALVYIVILFIITPYFDTQFRKICILTVINTGNTEERAINWCVAKQTQIKRLNERNWQ